MWGPHPGGQKSQGSALRSLVWSRRGSQRVPQKSQGSASWSLLWLVRDLQGVLPPGASGLVSDGHHGGTLSPHMLVQSWSIGKLFE